MRAFVVGLALSAFVYAAPNEFKARDSCNADNCSRAVFGSRVSSRDAQASSDCSSFLRATVSPCTTTSTVTRSITVTSSTSTVTAYTTVATLTMGITTVTTATVTATSTTFTATVTTTLAANAKRAVDADLAERAVDLDADLVGRAVTTCPSSSTPTAIPSYASACSGAARFSSVCSCRGIYPSTTTLATPTAVVTESTTVGVVATTTVTSSVTVMGSSTTTSTTTTTVTTTLSTQATATCNPGTYFLQLASNGLLVFDINPPSATSYTSVNYGYSPTLYTFDALGHITYNLQSEWRFSPTTNYIYDVGDGVTDPTLSSFYAITCSGYSPGVTASLDCGGQFYYLPGSAILYFGYPASSPNNVMPVTIMAVPQCQM